MAQDDNRSALYDSLKALCRGEGIHKPNLQRRLGEQLRSCWRIEALDSDEQVFAIVKFQIERLIKRLDDEELGLVARVHFNIEPLGYEHKDLTRRRHWLVANHPEGAVDKTYRLWMTNQILPAFERYLRDEDFLQSREEVLAAISPPHPTTDSSIVATASESRYIRRVDLETKLADAIKSDARVLLLFGDAGTGKSTIARRVGHDLAKTASKGAVEIDVKSEGSLIDDIVRVLDRQQITIPERDVLVKERFKELLAGPQAPSVVILDNADDWRVVEELIPKTPQATIFITSRNKLHTRQAATDIRVEEMTSEEAVAMIRSRLGNVNDDDCQALAEALSHRPLAIEHACGFLSQDDMPVKDFYLALKQSVTTVLDKVVDHEPTLTAIYRMSINRLDPDSLSLADLIVAAGGGQVSCDFLQAMWKAKEAASLDQRESSLHLLRLKKALRTLEGRSLIQSISPYGGGSFVWMHLLTRKILFELRDHQCAEVFRDSLELVEAMPAVVGWQVGRSLPIWIATQAQDLRSLLSGLVRLMRDVKPYPHLAMFAALAVRAEAQDWPSPEDSLRPAYHVLHRYEKIRRDAHLRAIGLEIGGDASRKPNDNAESERRRRDHDILRYELLAYRSLFSRQYFHAAAILYGTREMKLPELSYLPYLSLGVEGQPGQ